MNAIHNFSIIAHIDHGKSSLADRMLEMTHTVEDRQMREQMLDVMDLEREKGITIKMQPVRMLWNERIFNLIDTPGHVDFQYEVSRSLQAVEGAVLLVDATQGIQAQTVSNVYLAMEQELELIPVVNKIDLPAADVEGTKRELAELLGTDPHEVIAISAKTGEGVEQVLAAIAERVPSAEKSEGPLRALIFDSVYDDYKGVVAYVRILQGSVEAGTDISFLGTEASDRVVELGTFAPAWMKADRLSAGEIGYIATGLKDIRHARVGDTITVTAAAHEVEPLAGFKIPQPKVFAGIFPADASDYPELREAIQRLQLNDASLSVQGERSQALGQGYRCGFLGMLHLDIIQERIKREYEVEILVTTPSVKYRVITTDGVTHDVHTPDAFPDAGHVQSIEEQYCEVEVIVPSQYLGATFEVMKQHEGSVVHQEHVSDERLLLRYEMPLRELVVDLYDQLKSATSGFGSLSYEIAGWRAADVVKLSLLVNHEEIEAFATIVPRDKAEKIGRSMVERLKDIIPRQQFAVPLQAAVGGSIVARETLLAMRKDVTGALYGGDVTRKRKLLEKQKKGKKKMASQGSVEIPPEAYVAMLKRSGS